MKKFITLFSLICAFVCAVSCSSSSTPSSVAEQQMKAMKSGDFDKLADLFYFEPDEAEEGKQMISGLTSKLGPQIEEKGGIKSYEIISEEISEDGESATVVVSITYGNGSVDEEDIDTVMHDGKWYLHFSK